MTSKNAFVVIKRLKIDILAAGRGGAEIYACLEVRCLSLSDDVGTVYAVGGVTCNVELFAVRRSVGIRKF